jgi:toxin CptA
MHSSDASSPCRLEWRRSRWLPVALCVLAGAAIVALWLSSLPPIGCATGSVLVLTYIGWLLHREAHRPDCELSWAGGDALWQLEYGGRIESLRHVGASFRGGLVVLTLIDADDRRRRYIWWPDTLDAHGRRALRLAMRVETSATPIQSKLAQ